MSVVNVSICHIYIYDLASQGKHDPNGVMTHLLNMWSQRFLLSHTHPEKPRITPSSRARPFKPGSPPVLLHLSVMLSGSSEEGSDGQMRARSRSLPQRQQQQSCVLLPTSHHLLLLSCPPPPTASCGPLVLQPAANRKWTSSHGGDALLTGSGPSGCF